MIAIGADVSNAFTKAHPPVAPLYITIDQAYHEWWEQHLGLLPIPKSYVMLVNHAIQRHPEALHLWEKVIKSILCE